MLIRELQEDILRIKRERKIAILAHTYEAHEILEIADLVGDSFALAKQGRTLAERELLLCGVRFMAETVKLLSPERRVLLASPDAGCPMAEQFSKEEVLAWRAEHPNGIVVAYVNTTATLKCISDYCVTSASALKVVSALPDDREILFIPDCNLGSYIAKHFPQKRITLWNGGCPVHAAVTEEELADARRAHPNALLLTHPECKSEIAACSDFIGSTSEIMDYAKKSTASEFIIGTETNIVTHLQYELPEKRFFPLSKGLICRDMRLTTLADVRAALLGEGGEEIFLSDEIMKGARTCIDRMIALG